MEKWTFQSAFNRVWKHFVVEGHPRALCSDLSCSYITVDGKRCAIGILIPEFFDEYGNLDMIIDELFMDYPELAEKFESPDHDFWGKLQQTHDRPQNSVHGDIKEGLKVLATKYNLTIPN